MKNKTPEGLGKKKIQCYFQIIAISIKDYIYKAMSTVKLSIEYTKISQSH